MASLDASQYRGSKTASEDEGLNSASEDGGLKSASEDGGSKEGNWQHTVNLFKAAESGDTSVFEDELSTSLSVRDMFGDSLLHVAAQLNQIQMATFLVEKSEILLNSPTKDYSGYAPIHIAIIYGRIDMLKKLIDLGANVHLKIFMDLLLSTVLRKEEG